MVKMSDEQYMKNCRLMYYLFFQNVGETYV